MLSIWLPMSFLVIFLYNIILYLLLNNPKIHSMHFTFVTQKHMKELFFCFIYFDLTNLYLYVNNVFY